MMKTLKQTGLGWIWVAIVVLVLDVISKHWVRSSMELNEVIRLVPSLNLYYAHNYGAAFSFLADKGGWQRWIFALIAIVIIIGLLVMQYQLPRTERIKNIAYSLIIGGALGNLIDRAFHGFVVDFIDFYVGGWHFATFNIADCGICIGAALVIIEGLLPTAKSAQGAGK
jgi:signal peptidase II